MTLRQMIDRHYGKIRKIRFLYGWLVDLRRKRAASARAAEWQGRNFQGAKLDVCGGRNPFRPGEYLNVDVVPMPQVDLVFDITRRFPVPDDAIAEIVSIATLEHLRKPHVDHVLGEFFRILRPGGLLRVSTPDMEAIARAILDSDDLARINQHLFGKFKGDATEDLDLHKWMYPAGAMMEQLRLIGFTDVGQRPMEEIGMHDARLNYLIAARKPSGESR